MNYDHLEREVLGYEADMRRRAECRRALRGALAATAAGVNRGSRPVRVRVATALHSLANQLEARPANL
jgi:hypothetical protein